MLFVDVCSLATKLAGDVPEVVKAMAKQLKERSLKSRVGGLQLLRELVGVAPAAVTQHLAILAPGIITALKVPSTSLKRIAHQSKQSHLSTSLDAVCEHVISFITISHVKMQLLIDV